MKKIIFISLLVLSGCCHTSHQKIIKNVDVDNKGNIHTYDDKGNISGEGFIYH